MVGDKIHSLNRHTFELRPIWECFQEQDPCLKLLHTTDNFLPSCLTLLQTTHLVKKNFLIIIGLKPSFVSSIGFLNISFLLCYITYINSFFCNIKFPCSFLFWYQLRTCHLPFRLLHLTWRQHLLYIRRLCKTWNGVFGTNSSKFVVSTHCYTHKNLYVRT